MSLRQSGQLKQTGSLNHRRGLHHISTHHRRSWRRPRGTVWWGIERPGWGPWSAPDDTPNRCSTTRHCTEVRQRSFCVPAACRLEPAVRTSQRQWFGKHNSIKTNSSNQGLVEKLLWRCSTEIEHQHNQHNQARSYECLLLQNRSANSLTFGTRNRSPFRPFAIQTMWSTMIPNRRIGNKMPTRQPSPPLMAPRIMTTICNPTNTTNSATVSTSPCLACHCTSASSFSTRSGIRASNPR